MHMAFELASFNITIREQLRLKNKVLVEHAGGHRLSSGYHFESVSTGACPSPTGHCRNKFNFGQ